MVSSRKIWSIMNIMAKAMLIKTLVFVRNQRISVPKSSTKSPAVIAKSHTG